LGIQIAFVLWGYEKPLTVPSLCWIPDFQHLHYPEFFSKNELAERNANYQRWISEATRVIVSSQAAYQDLTKFTPQHADKARVLRFVAVIPGSVYEQEPVEIASLYHLPDRFFLLPNQFWAHKNHRAVLHSLELARLSCPEVTIVCTGSTRDHRNPFFFDEILTEIARLDIQKNIRILGQIPQEHVYQLMRRSLAVIQPSLFEGWSTSVEEAKSLGKHIVLSDIPTHREQSPHFADYFSTDSPRQLAEILVDLYRNLEPGPDRGKEGSARSELSSRIIAMAASFDDIVLEALGG
jgi:glycosyltransferase involved in cell wall biosynthesis